MSAPSSAMRTARQEMVRQWVSDTFGADISKDVHERGLRFIEEAVELVECCGVPRDTICEIVARVYSRPGGEVTREAGQVGVTLLALCSALHINADEVEHAEAHRVVNMPPGHFKARQNVKAAQGLGRYVE